MNSERPAACGVSSRCGTWAPAEDDPRADRKAQWYVADGMIMRRMPGKTAGARLDGQHHRAFPAAA